MYQVCLFAKLCVESLLWILYSWFLLLLFHGFQFRKSENLKGESEKIIKP